MTTVRFSQVLIDAVNNALTEAHEKRYELMVRPKSPEANKTMLELVKRAHRRVAWGEFVDLEQRMPPNWKTVCERGYTSIYNSSKRRILNVNLQYSAPTLFLPPDRSAYDTLELSVAGLHETANTDEERDAIDAFVAAEQEHHEHVCSTSETMGAFLEKHKSLNTAVKEWPGITMYVPPEYVQRMHEKKAKPDTEGVDAAAAPAPEVLNFEQLAAAGVIRKLNNNT